MSKLQSLLEDFKEAIFRLEEVLEQEKNDFIRDSAIQRFEFVFDLSWKTIKAFLEEYHNATCTSPKTCFREAFHQALIEYDDFWIDIADYRNKTAHTYKKELAEEVYAILPQTLSYFQKLLETIQQKSKKFNM